VNKYYLCPICRVHRHYCDCNEGSRRIKENKHFGKYLYLPDKKVFRTLDCFRINDFSYDHVRRRLLSDERVINLGIRRYGRGRAHFFKKK